MAPKPQFPPVPPHEDQSSPYYLSSSDNPGVQLVTQQLNGSNYVNWNRSMMTALMAKNKLAFVDGTIDRPQPTEAIYSQWLRCNSMVVSWLRNSVVPDISSSLMYLDDASLIWNDLKDRFAQGNVARVYQLKQQLLTLKQGSDDVGAYYTKLRILWDEYKDFQPSRWCTCDTCRCHSSRKWCEFQMQECSMQFLIGLSSVYSQIRSQIISSLPFPSLSKIFALVLQEERQRSIDSVSTPAPPIISEMPGSIINAAGIGRGKGGKGKFLCTNCGKTNHTVDKCFEIIGYPPGYGKGKGKSTGFSSNGARSVNQLSAADNTPSHQSTTLSTADMAQMISYLQSQMQVAGSMTTSAPTMNDVKTHGHNSTSAGASPPFSGSFSGDCDWEG
ncbi:uncharacterized protein LOC131008970 [Salvia miltiorrhiza]|uniref:uncharacterized protein LOC131008970 n=2 Tax=Salvia miltiorrhiza TaxID=226208 RepID=UPI0025AD14B2|nr:uncharacterized protein LOC131008970 [Salvia miltiorrhiza]